MDHCPYCDKISTTKSIRAHVWRVHTDAGKAHRGVPKGYKHSESRQYRSSSHKAWNKGLTKETDTRVAKYSDSLKHTFRKMVDDGSFVRRKMGEAARRRLSIAQSIKNRSGKSKWFVVDGQHVQGTWERDFASHLSNCGVEWIKLKVNTDVWDYYDDEGRLRSYTPDFFLPTLGVFIEIKGVWWGKDFQKMIRVQNTHGDKKLIIVRGKLLQQILQSATPQEIMEREQVWSLCYSEKVEN